MVEITTIGLDIAKNVFQVHGIDGAGEVALRRQLRRAQVVTFFGKLPRCLVGMEACGSAHYWGCSYRRAVWGRLGHAEPQLR